ncbi:unnamed protein product [Caenorhabditis brenneri]
MKLQWTVVVVAVSFCGTFSIETESGHGPAKSVLSQWKENNFDYRQNCELTPRTPIEKLTTEEYEIGTTDTSWMVFLQYLRLDHEAAVKNVLRRDFRKKKVKLLFDVQTMSLYSQFVAGRN